MENYEFSNLLGSMYSKGNITFGQEDFILISPVGNRITLYNLKNHTTKTLPVESNFNFTAIGYKENILLAGNEIGELHVISLIGNTLVHMLKLGGRIDCIRFSPNETMFAVAKDTKVFIYSASLDKAFNPFSMERVAHESACKITFIDWSFDSNLFLVCSEDMMIRVFPMNKYSNFKGVSRAFTAHSDIVVSAFFDEDNYDIYSLSRNGQLCYWKCSELPSGFILETKTKNSSSEEKIIAKKSKFEDDDLIEDNSIRFIKQERWYYSDLFKGEKSRPLITCSDYNRKNKILVTGFSNGSFFIHEMPSFTLIQSLNISDHEISTISLNKSGNWIGFGCPTLGQLLVWEWQSETYIMKQQGHYNTMNVFEFSSDGTFIATGGDDGKLKIWNTLSSFCLATFDEHTSGVTGIAFTQNGKAVISSSLDGTVRAFDLNRYRNFRTMTSPRPVQFSCVTVDASKEFVAAGGQDVFDIYIWSLKTGRLLEVLAGHEGPISSLFFTPCVGEAILGSLSWDKSFRLWEAIESSTQKEILLLDSEGTSFAFRPDGKEIAIATLDCQISFFDTKNCTQKGSIEGRNHLDVGRSVTDKITAQKNLLGRSFTTICYSSDGKFLLCGGQSKNICMYEASKQVLVKVFYVSRNRSLDAMDDFVNKRKMSEFGNMDLVEDRDDNTGQLKLPGSKKLDKSTRTFNPEIRVSAIRFSPTGRTWGAASSEGLLLYASDTEMIFNPIQADETVTSSSIRTSLKNNEYDLALMKALKLNLQNLIREVVETTPSDYVSSICRSVPFEESIGLLNFLGEQLGTSTHLQFTMLWITEIFKAKMDKFSNKNQLARISPTLNLLIKNLTEKQEPLAALANHNRHTMRYLINLGTIQKLESKEPIEVDDSVDSP